MPSQRSLRTLLTLTIAICGSLTAEKAFAAEPPVNLGSTSFMDGFGDPTGSGLIYLNYLSWAHASKLKTPEGDLNVSLNAVPDLNQFLYSFAVPESFIGQPGLNLIVPLVELSSSPGAGAPPLQSNGFGLGDILFGVFFQLKPIRGEDHHPIFAQRFEFDVNAPTGKYDATKAINQSAHAWSINPYWAATLLPGAGLEISTRLQYLYNFKNTDPEGGPTGTPSNTQEGQAVFDNFAVAYEVLPHNEARAWAHSLRVGLNGYYFKQISENKSEGNTLSNSKEQTFGIGPGAMWVASHTDAFWLNIYFETAVQNRFQSDVFQIRWAHAFESF